MPTPDRPAGPLPATTPTAREPQDPLYDATVTERRRLAALLTSLDPDGWAHPSLCAGWQVREVVAHVTMPYRHSAFAVLRGIAAARGSFNRYADRAAHRDTERLSDAELLDSYASNVESTWQPPKGGQVGALSHEVIHGLDITEALGLPGPPAETIRHVLAGAAPKNVAYFGVDLDGARLEAADVDWSLGEGRVHRAPAKELLLVITGRRPLQSLEA